MFINPVLWILSAKMAWYIDIQWYHLVLFLVMSAPWLVVLVAFGILGFIAWAWFAALD